MIKELKKQLKMDYQQKVNKITYIDILIYLIILVIVSFFTYSWLNQKEETKMIESNFEVTTGRIIKFQKGQKGRFCFEYEYVYKNEAYLNEFFGSTFYPDNYLFKKYPVKVYVEDPSKSIIVIDSLDGKSD